MAIKQIYPTLEATCPRREFILDTEEDVQNLPESCAPGSAALVADGGAIYLLNASGEWKKVK